MPRRRFSLSPGAWPMLDRQLTDLAFEVGDVLDGHGPGAHWQTQPDASASTVMAFGSTFSAVTERG